MLCRHLFSRRRDIFSGVIPLPTTASQGQCFSFSLPVDFLSLSPSSPVVDAKCWVRLVLSLPFSLPPLRLLLLLLLLLLFTALFCSVLVPSVTRLLSSMSLARNFAVPVVLCPPLVCLSVCLSRDGWIRSGGVARADRGGRAALLRDAAGGAQVGAGGNFGPAHGGADGARSAEGGVRTNTRRPCLRAKNNKPTHSRSRRGKKEEEHVGVVLLFLCTAGVLHASLVSRVAGLGLGVILPAGPRKSP